MTAGAAPPTQGTYGLPRPILILVGSAAAVIVAMGVKMFGDIVATVMLAVVLTMAVMPIVKHGRNHGWPTWLSTILALVAAYAIVLVLAIGVATSVVKLAATIPQYIPDANALKDELVDKLHSLGLNTDPTNTAASQLNLSKVLSFVTSLLTSLLGILSSLFFLVTVMFFTVAEVTGLHARAVVLRQTRPRLLTALIGYVKVIQQYLLVTTLFGAIVAFFDTIALYVLSVPLALQWGFLSFVTNFIPNIGFVIGVIPPALMALLANGWQSMVIVIVVYCVLNVVIQTFIQPRIVGDTVGLGTTVTFLSVFVWTVLIGPMGALLAVPMTLLARTLLVDADPNAGWVMALLGQPPQQQRPAKPT